MPRIPHSDICYGGIPMLPMGDARYPHEGKGDIPNRGLLKPSKAVQRYE